jgi:hypothetical protein
MVTVWRRLLSTAQQFLREAEVGLTVSGRIYLWRLLQKGAVKIVSEGKGHDEREIGRAQVATERLLDAAAGLSAANGPEQELGLFLGMASTESSRRISAANLRLALGHLCPLWPFCE